MGRAVVELHAAVLARLERPPFAGQVAILHVSPMDGEFRLVTVESSALPDACRAMQELYLDGDKVRFKDWADA